MNKRNKFKKKSITKLVKWVGVELGNQSATKIYFVKVPALLYSLMDLFLG
jgi:hypothetical protein